MNEIATFAGGCFWCTEAIFQKIKGVESVVSGYTGGDPPAGGENPSYEEVCSGSTGHAESIQVEFNPGIISYKELLEIFFKLHDPTTLNRQGNDVGTQYRSAIFYHDNAQKKIAEEMMKKLDEERTYKDKIVTEIEPFTKFYEAEDYHRNYYESNKNTGYCKVIIDPKIKKLYDTFPNLTIGTSSKER